MKIFSRADSNLVKKTIQIYREEASHERKGLLLAAIFAPMQHFLYMIVPPLLIGFITQSVIANPHDIQTPLWLIGGLVVCMFGSVIAGHIGFISLFNHEEKMSTRLLTRAMNELLAHSYTFFANNKVGALAGDVNTFSRSYMAALDTIFLQASPILVNFVISIIIVAFIAPLMVPILLLMTITIVAQALMSYAERGELRKTRKDMQSKLFGSTADVLGNQTLVRMFGRAHFEVNMLARQRRALEDITVKDVQLLQKGAEIRLVLLFVFQIATLLFCIWLITHSLMSIAAFIFIITYLGRVTSTMYAINGVIRTLEQAFLDAAKVTEILDKTPDVRDKPNAKDMIVNDSEIRFDKVSFSYEDAKGQIVFKNMDLVIPHGQSIGLVGKSGGGKSTLTHLLLRYMDIDKGEISIDGQNIADVTQDSLRRAVAYVPQDPFLFHRSLRDNIAYGKPDATDEEIMHAALNSYAYEFIKQLPNGFDTIVGERGVKLSGGQRQRIAIARAILKDAPILVLDEATSALDSESEVYIQQALEKLMKDRTSIVIAHRLSTIAKLDRIIVLDKGKIIEDGGHSDLRDKRGIYAKLWKHQSGGFIEE
jgi:ATP-binding cassette subfamily B protein